MHKKWTRCGKKKIEKLLIVNQVNSRKSLRRPQKRKFCILKYMRFFLIKFTSNVYTHNQLFFWGGPNYLTEIYSELILILASSLTYILRGCFIQDQHFVEEDPMICPKSTESIFTSSSMLIKRGFFTQNQHFVKKDPIICPRSTVNWNLFWLSAKCYCERDVVHKINNLSKRTK